MESAGSRVARVLSKSGQPLPESSQLSSAPVSDSEPPSTRTDAVPRDTPPPLLLRRYEFTGPEGVGGQVSLVGSLSYGRSPEGNDDFFLSEDRLEESPIEERVHFWSWFAWVSPGTPNPTWIVECYTAEPPASPVAPGGHVWDLIVEGRLETGALSFDIATMDESFSSNRTVKVNETAVNVRVHLTDRRAARAREDVWFDAQDWEASGYAWPQAIPASDLNPVLLQVRPART